MSRQDGFTLLEMLIVVAVVGILSAIAIPALQRARATSNETAALGALRTISSAEAAYASTCGRGGYATDFATLATPPRAGGGAFLTADLAAATTESRAKSGYVFNLAATATSTDVASVSDTCSDATGPSKTEFFATAGPTRFGDTGSRYFAANQAGAIREDDTALSSISDGRALQN